MKKLSADSSLTIALKMPPALRGELSRLSRKSEQSESAVIRAALRLSFPLLEAHPELVKQLDAGVSDEGMKSLLARARAIADKTGVGIVVPLRAALRLGLMGFEAAGEQLNAEYLRFVDMGGLEMPTVSGMINTFTKAPVIEKAAEAAALLHSPDEATIQREAKERGITEETIAGTAKPAPKPVAVHPSTEQPKSAAKRRNPKK